ETEIATTGDVVIGRSGNNAGCIDVSGDPGGSITIEAGGSINLQGKLDAHSTSAVSFAGDVTLTGLQITTDPKAVIDVRGGNQGISGTVSMDTTAGMTLHGTISGRANSAAEVDLTAKGGNVDVTAATFDLPGSGLEGFGGTVSFDATGNIDTTGATFTMTGSQSGDGGDMNFDADGSVILGGKIQLRGDAADDFGGSSGEIDASAGADIRITATQLDLTGAPNGEGGNAFFDADGDIIQSAAIDASGNGP